MTKIEKSIVIEAPVEKVFAFVNDFDNYIKTSSPEMEILSRDEGPQRVGFKTKVRSKLVIILTYTWRLVGLIGCVLQVSAFHAIKTTIHAGNIFPSLS